MVRFWWFFPDVCGGALWNISMNLIPRTRVVCWCVCGVWDISGAHIHLSNTISDRARWSSHQAINHIHPDTSKHTCNNAHLTCAAHTYIWVTASRKLLPWPHIYFLNSRGDHEWHAGRSDDDALHSQWIYIWALYTYTIYTCPKERCHLSCVYRMTCASHRDILFIVRVCVRVYVPLEWYPSTACNKWGEWVIAGHRWEAFV